MFLEEFGHIDFTLLPFQPNLLSVEEYQELRDFELKNSSRFIKNHTLLATNPGAPVIRKSNQKKKKLDKSEKKGISDIEIAVVDDEVEIVIEDLEPKLCERFDFTFNDLFYSLNIEIDEYGERITSKSLV